MIGSVDYPAPVQVNGYTCRNCTDVDYAKKNIDPAHPKDGPDGIFAKDKGGAFGSAVKLGGALDPTAGPAALGKAPAGGDGSGSALPTNGSEAAPPSQARPFDPATGSRLDLSA